MLSASLEATADSCYQVLHAAHPELVSFKVFRQALETDLWADMLNARRDRLDLRDHSEGSACLAAQRSLAEIVSPKLESRRPQTYLQIITSGSLRQVY